MVYIDEIIPISFQSQEVMNDTDICCPAKKPSTPVKRVTRRTAQPGEVAPIWPLTGDTRKPEHIPQQPTQRQVRPHKIVVQAEVPAPMEPLEPEVPVDPQRIDEPLDQDQGNPPPTPEESVEQEAEVPEEPLQVPIVTHQPKPMVLEQPLPQVLPMPKPMPFAIPKVPDQPIPFQGLINPRPLDIRLLGTLPGYDEDDKDDRNQPEVSIRQPDKTMYRKSKKLFDEIQDEMIFRKHLPIQKANAVTIAEALLNRIVYQFGSPKTLIIDEDRTLLAGVLMHIYNTLNMRSQVISPLNHGSLRTERYIRSISEMLCKHLKDNRRKLASICESMLLCIKHICVPIHRILSI